MKTKYFILGLATCIFGISYTNAITITSDGTNYTPETITFDNDISGKDINVGNFDCSQNNCYLILGTRTDGCTFTKGNGDISVICSETVTAGTHNIKANTRYGMPFNNISINYNENTTNGTIIEGGIDNFTPVISRMLEIAGEFIPYIVYIFIGYLGVILLWNAVKYILGYLKGKSEGTVREINESNSDRERDIKEMFKEAEEERDIEKEMYQDYEDYIYKHGKYKDGNYPTQEERLERIRQRKENHKEYNYF